MCRLGVSCRTTATWPMWEEQNSSRCNCHIARRGKTKRGQTRNEPRTYRQGVASSNASRLVPCQTKRLAIGYKTSSRLRHIKRGDQASKHCCCCIAVVLKSCRVTSRLSHALVHLAIRTEDPQPASLLQTYLCISHRHVVPRET